MTTAVEVLRDGFGRVHEVVHGVLDGLGDAALTVRLDPEANSIGWLVWHLTRVQDDHVAGVAGTPQVWTATSPGAPPWCERFALPYPSTAIGYGQSAANVGQFGGVSVEQLLGYLDAVHEATLGYLDGLSDADLGQVVDEAWDPPVTLAVRLVSVIGDDLQHAGQAAFVRGVLERR